MKQLTLKFRETFQKYEYTELNISILSSLLDIILEIIPMLKHEDVYYIKKLQSFVKLFSSDSFQDIMDIDETIIDDIYEEKIMPILLHLDHKYGDEEPIENIDDSNKIYYDTDSKELCNIECSVFNDEKEQSPNQNTNSNLLVNEYNNSDLNLLNNIDKKLEIELKALRDAGERNRGDPDKYRYDLLHVLQSTTKHLYKKISDNSELSIADSININVILKIAMQQSSEIKLISKEIYDIYKKYVNHYYRESSA